MSEWRFWRPRGTAIDKLLLKVLLIVGIGWGFAVCMAFLGFLSIFDNVACTERTKSTCSTGTLYHCFCAALEIFLEGLQIICLLHFATGKAGSTSLAPSVPRPPSFLIRRAVLVVSIRGYLRPVYTMWRKTLEYARQTRIISTFDNMLWPIKANKLFSHSANESLHPKFWACDLLTLFCVRIHLSPLLLLLLAADPILLLLRTAQKAEIFSLSFCLSMMMTGYCTVRYVCLAVVTLPDWCAVQRNV